MPTGTYRNRIVGHGDVDPGQLLPHPQNFRVHHRSQEVALADSLAVVGWVDSLIVSARTDFVLDGYLRAVNAISTGQPSVPVDYVDLTDEEELLVLARHDAITSAAGIDRDKLSVVRDSLAKHICDSPEAWRIFARWWR